MKPNIGLTDVDSVAVVQLLNVILSDEFVLYTKTLNFHWNVKGPHFSALHTFFESQYRELADIIDVVAERARALGGRAFGTMTAFVEYSRLEEAPGLTPSDEHMIEILLKDHETLIQNLRKDLETCSSQHNDAGTNNLLTDLMEKHEKMAWMLRASTRKD